MNVIDKAHELARAIKDSSEVSDITSAMKVIEADPESKQMLDNFRQSQIEPAAADDERGHASTGGHGEDGEAL